MADVTNPREFLEELQDLADRLDQNRQAEKKEQDLKKQLDTSLASLKNTIEREKTSTVKSRRADIESGFDKQLKAVNSDIKKLGDKRQKALSSQMKKRSAEATSGIRQQVKDARKSLGDYVSEKKLPFIMKSRIYYALFCPVFLGYLLLLAVFVLLLVIAAVYARAGIMSGTTVWPFVVLGIADIFLLFAYIIIWANTRVRYRDEIKELMAIVKSVRTGEKQAKKIEKDIIKAGDDNTYDLAKYDSELAEKTEKKKDIESRKSEALDNFDNVTKKTIIDGIDESYRSKLCELDEKISSSKGELENLGLVIHELETRINSEFMPYVGAKNVTHDAVGRMIALIDAGEASSVAEAVSALSQDKGKKDK